MLFSQIDLLDEQWRHVSGAYVGVRGERIAYIGAAPPEADFGEVYDGRGKLLMSGFYNAHAHTPMTLMRGYGENLALQEWLADRIFPFEACLTGRDVYWGSLLGYAESLRFGIVSTSDMYYFCEEMVQAALAAGVKTNVSRGITAFAEGDLYQSEGFKEAKKLYETWHGAGEGRILADMSLHAEYTSNPTAVRQLAEYTRDIGARMQVHLSETRKEHEDCKIRHGKTPTAYFADLGLLDVPTTAAHGVYVDAEDRAILKEKGVTIASNPTSNMKLASGICPVSALLDQGVPVAIGTDSVASNNNLDFIEEVKAFALLAKVREADPTRVTPAQALHAATRVGALAQGRSDCGLLKEGFRADLIVLDIAQPHFYPVHDMATNVVYSASGGDVCLTVVDGRVLYRDGQFPTIDIQKVFRETAAATARITAGLH